MIVTTQSGSIYFFTQKEDGTYFRNGLTSGKLINTPVPNLGERMRLNYLPYSIYEKLGDEPAFIETTPVVSIK